MFNFIVSILLAPLRARRSRVVFPACRAGAPLASALSWPRYWHRSVRNIRAWPRFPVSVSPVSRCLDEVWEFETSDGVCRVSVSGPVTSNSGEVIRDAAVGGLGIAIKSLWDVANQLRGGELVSVLDDFPLPTVDIFALYLDRKFVPPKVRAWIDFLKQRFWCDTLLGGGTGDSLTPMNQGVWFRIHFRSGMGALEKLPS
ncbi:MAG: hypothetical protein IPJ21_18410 [Sterolibacteriaceae bacterium]|nr:hypothetical protein [Sterolibacteriaceae bacterium]MBK9085715.1 hypothetical protein [Sterolibacteriaceae bacterium]